MTDKISEAGGEWKMVPVVKFLLGEAKLEGCWFGDPVPPSENPRHTYWWRKHLREAFTASPPSPASQAAVPGMTDAQLRTVIARDIWAYNECPWPFDEPPEGMAQLQKQIAIDQAERICKVVATHVLAEEDETYEIGKRDGYELAVQEIDLATGGDGEFTGSTLPGATVDVPVMKQRIIDRLAKAQPDNRVAELESALRQEADHFCAEAALRREFQASAEKAEASLAEARKVIERLGQTIPHVGDQSEFVRRVDAARDWLARNREPQS